MSYLFPADGQALQSMASDAGNSTFDALIHTQLDVNVGLTIGNQVGQQGSHALKRMARTEGYLIVVSDLY
jgi:hypothetical protein